MAETKKQVYDESKIKTLSSIEHIRLRTGMYIGRIGDGSHYDDGCYILLKEVIDNAVDEFIIDRDAADRGKWELRTFNASKQWLCMVLFENRFNGRIDLERLDTRLNQRRRHLMSLPYDESCSTHESDFTRGTKLDH